MSSEMWLLLAIAVLVLLPAACLICYGCAGMVVDKRPMSVPVWVFVTYLSVFACAIFGMINLTLVVSAELMTNVVSEDELNTKGLFGGVGSSVLTGCVFCGIVMALAAIIYFYKRACKQNDI